MTSEAERRMARYKEERRRQLALQVAARLSSAASSSEEEESDKVSYAEYRRRRRRREAGGRGEAPGLLSKQLSRRAPEHVRPGGSLQQLSGGRKDCEEEHIYHTIGSLASLPGNLTTEPARYQCIMETVIQEIHSGLLARLRGTVEGGRGREV